MITPILESRRIISRPAKITDADAIFNNWTSDPDVSHFMRWNTHASIDETVAWLTGVEANIANDNYDWLFVLKKTGEPFGSGGIFFNATHDVYELGYCIMKREWGKGFATEAARTILDFATRELGLTKFFACHAVKNPASGKVLQKLGFVYSGDGSYTSFDGKRAHATHDYFLEV